MTNKDRIAFNIGMYEEAIQRIDAKIADLQEQIARLQEERDLNEEGIHGAESWLLEINEMDGEDAWTW